ncbi:MAG: hypothetical protein F4X91_02090 [Nitrospinae bacterium]|nr:hypothetical protein [Nitrospinota bacterium]
MVLGIGIQSGRKFFKEQNDDRIRSNNPGIPKIDSGVAKAAITAQYAAVWVAGAVGFAQCALIVAGLLFMRRAAIARDKTLDILMKRAEEHG